jgi:hypothetical protein
VPIARADRLLAVLAIAIAAAAQAGAAELGTLFNTPQERARLDSLRRGEAPERGAISGPGAHEITGYVHRSDGRNTVWVDGVPLTVASPAPAPIFDPKSVRGYADHDNAGLRIERRPAK